MNLSETVFVNVLGTTEQVEFTLSLSPYNGDFRCRTSCEFRQRKTPMEAFGTSKWWALRLGFKNLFQLLDGLREHYGIEAFYFSQQCAAQERNPMRLEDVFGGLVLASDG